MKIDHKLILAGLLLVGVSMYFVLVKTTTRRIVKHPSDGSLIQEPPERVHVAAQTTADESLMQTPYSGGATAGPVADQIDLHTSAVPTELIFKTGLLNVPRAELLSIVRVASNAVLSVDRILKTRNYQVNEFSRSFWLTSEDEAQSTIWRIFPYRTNAIVDSIEAIVYHDAEFMRKDAARSFRMSFDPETGVLRSFSWDDKHEVLRVSTNGMADYARDLGDQMGLVMRWDVKGDLVSSNVYNWATRGRVIGKTPQTYIPAYRLGPTSAEEAATESWRSPRP